MNSLVPDTFGIVTVVNDQPQYLEMAVDLALSCRQYGNVPASMLLDRRLAPTLNDSYKRLFDRVIMFDPSGPNDYRNLSKLRVAEHSPYPLTLYVDADCVVTSDLHRYAQGIEHSSSGYVMQGEYFAEGRRILHNGWYTDELCRRFGIHRYLKCNSGVIGMRKVNAIQIQSAIRASNDDFKRGRWLRGGWMSDEVLHGVAGERFGIDLFPEPLPMSWGLHYLDVTRPIPPILHAIGHPARATATWFFEFAAQLRRDAGLPVEPGRKAWRNKMYRKHWWYSAYTILRGVRRGV